MAVESTTARREGYGTWLWLAGAAVALAAGCSVHPRAPSSFSAAGVQNYHRLEDGIATANAITPSAIPNLAAAGFKTVIDLRAPSESGVAEEAAVAQQSDIKYVNIPVTLPTLSGEQVRAVARILDDHSNRPVLMHCSSGNRVGAVMELYREQIHGVDRATARKEAQTIGLTLPQAVEAVERVRREMTSSK